MSFPEPLELFDAVDATWAPESISVGFPFTYRNGAGGGKRVSAASLTTLAGEFDGRALERAESTMGDMGQQPLFMIRESESVLDSALEGRGYDVVDPVTFFVSGIDLIADLTVGDVHTIRCDGPLAVQRNIWSKGGVGPERLAVMERSANPKTFILGRYSERPVGSVFVSIHNGIGMLHSLEVDAEWRRNGIGRALTIACAKWAKNNGATLFGLLAVKDNTAATALYQRLGLEAATAYHYRKIARSDNSR